VTIRIAEPDARALESFCRRQLRWDERLTARIRSADNAIGVFTTPPLDVLAFVAVPAVIDGEIDRIVRLADWADLLQSHAGKDIEPSALAEPLTPVTMGLTLHDLPPADGWQVPIYAVSGDLVPKVSEATAEFEARGVGLPPREREELAREIWDRPAWGGLPMRVLHAARQLGMLSEDRSRVSAATCGSWKRLSTARGQVFVPVRGPAAVLALKPDR
jgi:hypothetical protein